MENSSSEIGEFLNKAIAETKDLHVLNILLDIKLSNSRALISRKLNFDPSFILTNETVDFDFVCDILRKASQVCDDFFKPLSNIVKYITRNHNDNKYQSNIIMLLDFLISICVKDGKAEVLFDQLKIEFVCRFLICALNNTESKEKVFVTLSSYFILFPRSEQIKCLNAIYEFCCKSNNLDVFCALLNHTPKEVIYSKSCCFSDDHFWMYVESCISGSESYLQKQGEYILSKNINSFTNHHTIKDISVPSGSEDSWSWHAFFILIDIGREKQLHLVAPSLNLFKYIYKLPFLWQKCIYKIYLEHSQTKIVYLVVIEVLKRNYVGDDFKEIIKLLFPAINKNEYNELSCEMFKTLHTFCAELGKHELEILMKELVQISWNAVSFWKVIQNVFTCENKSYITIDSFQGIISCAANLPHIYIRTECIKYLISMFWDDKNYSKMYKIVSYLKSDLVNIQYFQNSKFSRDIVDLVINDVLQFNDGIHDLQKIKICFMIFKYLKIDMWSYSQKYFHTLSPYVKLFVWIDYLFYNHDIEDSVILYEQIEAFLLIFFNDYLCEVSADYFIELSTLLASKYVLSNDTFFQVIDRPLFSPNQYNKNQIYVALTLLQEFLFKIEYNYPFLDTKIIIKERVGSVVIYFYKDDIVSNIEVKDSRICSECINLIFKVNKTFSPDCTKNVIDIFKIIIDFPGNKALFNLYRKCNDLLISSKGTNLVIEFVNVLHHSLSQIQKDQYFKGIVDEFIKLIYSETYFKYAIDNIASISKDLLEFSELYPLVRFSLITSLRKLCVNSSIYHEVCLVPLVDIYLQGTITTKDERTEFHICQEFIHNGARDREEYSPFRLGEFSNPNLLNAASRLLALETLLCIGHHDINLVINCLKERYMRNFKKRYFPDSKIHYEKLRIVQALLMIVAVVEMTELQTKQLSSFVFDCLQEETNQNCVKQLFNWILILVLREVSQVTEWINWRTTNVSPSILISVIPTIYHLTLCGNEETLETSLKMVLPWTMGAQFRLRVYAQDLIKKFLEHARQMKYDTFLNKYKHLEDCIICCIESTGDVFVNTMKSDLPFLNDFDPIRDKSLLTIFYDIPRLNNVYPTEWQNMHLFFSDPALLEDNELLQRETVFQSKSSIFTDSIHRFLNKDEFNTKQVDDQLNQLLHIQKKITPWKSALETVDTRTKTDFILIASLIDKSQNLGGLSRTCEVFGIRNIAFNDAKITNEKEFKSLSMSSEAWINATEVKVKDLRDYILRLQSEGYCIIGAEQTAGSLKLNEYQFPRKMALILGNEKTGIPPDIIPLLNVCLEIPQFGQTRSLNVHVAGATFIWEYAKQHLV